MLKTGHLNSGRVHFCIESVIVGMLPAKLDVGSHVSVFNYLPKSAQNEIRNLEALCPIPMRICNLLFWTHLNPKACGPFPLCAAEEPGARDGFTQHLKDRYDDTFCAPVPVLLSESEHRARRSMHR